MSRRKPVDNSTAVSLFPFLAVLLCTMGALLVVLVAVSRAAREAALRRSETQQQAATVEDDPEIRRELEKADQYTAKLRQLRGQAEKQLREDQLRMGHLEDHMRRLEDQLALLHAAAAELDALEEEHYDDREQAEREIERLERLVAETRKEVEDAKEELASQKHTYALIPYEGPNGTFRRPIYIECRNNELILQPEGVRVNRDDLQPPYGAGNPLAAALRAARDYYSQLRPDEGRSRDTEPYPLLVVRPEGLAMYNRARRAIQSSDFEFGFELVEDDWTLEYPVADPQLATLEQQAIEQARIRQQALAAAAPRAYRRAGLGVSGRFDSDERGGNEFGFWDEGSSAEGFAGGSLGHGGMAGGQSTDAPIQLKVHGGDASVAGQKPNPEAADTLTGLSGTAEDAAEDAHAMGPGTTPTDGTSASSPGGAGTEAVASANSAGAAGGASGNSSAAPEAGQQVVVSTGGQPQHRAKDAQQPAADIGGRNWGLDRKRPHAVPIRRTVQAVVRHDHVAILDDDAPIQAEPPRGKRIAIDGDTVESLEQIVVTIRQHIDGWGIAGDGLYWRPVLVLNVGADGRHRAEDLARLLHSSGLEMRIAELANNQPQGETRATR